MDRTPRACWIFVVVLALGCKKEPEKSAPEKPPTAASSATTSDKKLDCGFMKNEKNCYLLAAGSVHECIGDVPKEAKGKLTDGKTCKLGPLDITFATTTKDAKGITNGFDVTVRRGDKTCVHATTKALGEDRSDDVDVTPAGTISRRDLDDGVAYSCPDGTTYSATRREWEGMERDCNDARSPFDLGVVETGASSISAGGLSVVYFVGGQLRELFCER